MSSAEVPVLIAGAGPSGTMAALLLEGLGIETLLVERREGPQRAPAAHVVNARSFEICRAAGVDMKAIAAAAKQPSDAGYVYWVSKLGAKPLGRLPFERQGDDQLELTPTPLRNLSQNKFEPILFEALARVAGSAPRWRQEWQSAVQDGDLVRSRVLDLESGREHEISSRYLIGADGAGSRVRKALGIEPVGPEAIQSFIMIHFRAELRGIPEIPPGVLFFCADPDTGGGVFVVHDLDGEAVYMHAFDPNAESVEDYDGERCQGILRRALEDPSLPFTIEHVGSWVMTAQVAERYGQGRIFLVGDSAHRFPPTGGLGLNSGVQDAHNLAWKLAAVIQGWAPESLLDSYELERRPVAQNNADQSLRNALKLVEVPQALGFADSPSASRANMERVLADPDGIAAVRAAIEGQVEHFDMPGLQLGFCYEEGALCPDATDAAASEGSVRNFVPSGRPGSRLPHAWVNGDAGRESLLDWVPLGCFLLLAGPDGQAWIDAAAAREGVPIECRLLREADFSSDFDRWLALAGIESDGALLVRPDQHIGWRARRLATDPTEALTAALSTILGR